MKTNTEIKNPDIRDLVEHLRALPGREDACVGEEAAEQIEALYHRLRGATRALFLLQQNQAINPFTPNLQEEHLYYQLSRLVERVFEQGRETLGITQSEKNHG